MIGKMPDCFACIWFNRTDVFIPGEVPLSCVAFPNGIPERFVPPDWIGGEKHSAQVDGQFGDFVFTPIDGRAPVD